MSDDGVRRLGAVVVYDIGGEWLTCREIARRVGASPDTIRGRFRKGVRGAGLLAPVGSALFPSKPRPEPKRTAPRYDVGGEMLTIAEIAARGGVSFSAAFGRVQRGVRGPALLEGREPPVHDVGGEWLTVRQIADRTGIGISAVRKRISDGVRGADLLATRFTRLPRDCHALGYQRPGRGRPGVGEPSTREELDVLADTIRATLQRLEGERRLRRAIVTHAVAIIRALRTGARVSHLKDALIRAGIVQDSGRPLTKSGFASLWRSVEMALVRHQQQRRAA